MINQVKVEMYKFFRSIFFWLSMLLMITAGVYGGINWDVRSHMTEVMTPFNDTLPDMSLIFILSLFAAWFIGSSFGNRTIQHELSSGKSRLSVILSRAIPTVISGFMLHIAFIASTIVTLGMRIGFDSLNLTADYWFWILTISLQLIALECFFMFINFLCSNLYVGLIATTIASFVLVNIFRNIFRDAKWYQVSFLHFAETMKHTELLTCSIVSVVSIVALIALTYMVFRRREI